MDLQEDLALEFEDFDGVSACYAHRCSRRWAAAQAARRGGQIFGLLIGDTEEVFIIFAGPFERKVDALEARDHLLPELAAGVTNRLPPHRSSAPPSSSATRVKSTRRWSQSCRRCFRCVLPSFGAECPALGLPPTLTPMAPGL